MSASETLDTSGGAVLSHGRILLVDDEELLRRTYGRVLERAGHEVIQADSAEQALAVLYRETNCTGGLDLVILDLKLPGTSGITLLELIRREHPELPVIMVTGFPDVDSVVVALRAGAADYLIKPLGAEELQIKVSRVLEHAATKAANVRLLQENREYQRQLERELMDRTDELRDSRQRLSAAQRIGALGSWKWCQADGTVTLSSSTREMYGLPPEEGRYQIQQLIKEVVHPDDRAEFEQHLAEIERGKDVTFRVIRPDGEIRWIMGFSSTVEKRGPDGRPKQVLGFVKDVTRRAQLVLEGRMLWQAVEQSPVPVVITDRRGQITYVNPAFTSMSGYRWSDVIGRNPRLLQSGETLPEVHQDLWETVTSGQQWRGELINSTRDGEIYHQATTIGPVRGPNGEISHYVAVMEDITSRKQREAALERSHQQLAAQMLAQKRELRDTSEALRTETVSRRHAESSWRRVEEELEQVFHTAAGGMRVIDRDFRVVRANENLSRMTGVALSDMIGRKCWEDFGGPNCHTRRCTLRSVLAGAQVTGQEVTKITAKGREISCVQNVRELRDETGEVIGMIEDFQDLTEIRRLETVAEAVNLMDNLSFVFAGVRHELGNPINALKTTISVLLRRLPELEVEAVVEYLERCQSDIRRVEYLLRSLKSFSMFETPVVEVLHLSTFFERLEPLLRPDIEARGVSLVMPRSGTDLWMRADPRALQQVMLNLVTNAMDACADRPAPEVLLTAQRKDGLVELVLEDNGAGMNERQLNDLFKPFHTNKTNGTGLGLVIVKKLLAHMDGSITIESAPGEGARVVVLLPASEPADG